VTGPDFVAVWQDYIEQQRCARKKEPSDKRAWSSFAKAYETVVPTPHEILAVLASLVRPDDTLLDVGAGTGRLALPLAGSVRQVTALDSSPDMLAILRQKIEVQGLSNVVTVETRWENADVMPHDVVLAAWSLFSQKDILAALHKLVDSTRRLLILIAGDSSLDTAPHTALRETVCGKDYETPNYLCFAGLLRQMGIRADVRVIYEQRSCSAPSPETIARQLAPLTITESQLEAFTEALIPLLTHDADGYHYHYTLPVGIVTWNKE
jgi:precorrin-6B methylase 2